MTLSNHSFMFYDSSLTHFPSFYVQISGALRSEQHTLLSRSSKLGRKISFSWIKNLELCNLSLLLVYCNQRYHGLSFFFYSYFYHNTFYFLFLFFFFSGGSRTLVPFYFLLYYFCIAHASNTITCFGRVNLLNINVLELEHDKFLNLN